MNYFNLFQISKYAILNDQTCQLKYPLCSLDKKVSHDFSNIIQAIPSNVIRQHFLDFRKYRSCSSSCWCRCKIMTEWLNFPGEFTASINHLHHKTFTNEGFLNVRTADQ